MKQKIILILLLSLIAFCSDAQSLWSGTNYYNQKKSGNSVVNLSPTCPQPWVGYANISPIMPPYMCGFPMDTIGVYLPPWCGCDGEEFISTFICPQTTSYNLYQVWDASPGGIRMAIRPTDTTCSFNNFQLLYPDFIGNYFYIYKLNLDSGASYDILVDNCCDCNCNGDICAAIAIPPISNINISNVKADSLTLLWDSISQGDVAVEYGIKDFTLGSGTKVLNPPNPFVIGGLTPHTIYDFYVYQEIDTFKSCWIDRNRITTAYICDSTPYLYCDNHYIEYYVNGNACKDAWAFNSCPYANCATVNSNEFIFQFVPDSTGIHNLALLYDNYFGSYDYWSIYYKEASSGCNEQNWNFIVCGSSIGTWNANFGPLNSGQKYYLLFAGNQPSVSSCYYANYNIIGNFKLTGPSPICSQPPTGLFSNANNNNNNTICPGDSAQIFPVGSMLSSSGFYIWRKDSCSGSYISNLKVLTVAPLSTTTYFLQISDSCGMLACDSITIIVNTLPNNQLNLSGMLNLCAGDSIVLSATNVQGNSYQWIKNGINIIGAIAAQITVSDSGTYRIFISDSISCSVYSDSVTVALLDSPQVALSATATIFCVGDSVKLSTNFLGSVALQWMFNGSAIAGANDTIYYANQIGDYNATVIDSLGCKGTSNAISLTQSIPVADIIPSNGATVCTGDSAQLSTTSFQGYTYQWLHDGVMVNGATGTVLSTPNAGYYYVSVIDTIGCAALSDSVQVNLYALPQVSIVPSGILPYYLANPITIHAIADTLNSFQWFKNGIPILNAFGSSYTTAAHGLYKVRVTDTLGCENFSPTLFIKSFLDAEIVDSTMESKLINQSFFDSQAISIAPNPSHAITNVDLSLIAAKQFDICLKTITGQTVFYYHNYKPNFLIIDAARLSKGIYILHLTGEVNICRKFIVN